MKQNKTVKKLFTVIQIIFLFLSLLFLTPFGRKLLYDMLCKAVGHELSTYWWDYVFNCFGSFCSTVFAFITIIKDIKGRMFSKTELPQLFEKISEKIYKKKIFIIIIMTAISAVIGWLILNSDRGYAQDASEYIAGARELVTGVKNTDKPAYGYSWGVALLLAPFYSINGIDMLMLKIPMVILFSGTVAIIGWNAFKRFKGLGAATVLAVMSVNYMFADFHNSVLSDIPFLFFSSLSVVCLYEMYSDKVKVSNKIVAAIIAGVCTGFACQIRFNGMIIFLTAVMLDMLYLLQKTAFIKNEKYRLSKIKDNIKIHTPVLKVQLLYYVIFVAVYIFFAVFFPVEGRSDTGKLSGISIYTLCDNTGFYFWMMRNFFFEGINHIIRLILWILILPLVFEGVRVCIKEETVTPVYCLGTLALYILWPQTQGIRFIFPVIPFVIIYAVYGFGKIKNKIIRYFYLLLLAGYFLCEICADTAAISRNLKAERISAEENDFEDMCRYIRDNTPADAHILYNDPRLLYLMTQRGDVCDEKSEGWSENPEKLTEQLIENDYILVSDNSDFPEIFEENNIGEDVELELLYSQGKMTLYKTEKK